MKTREVPTIVLELSLAEAQAIRELALFVTATWANEDGNPELYRFAGDLTEIMRDY